MIALAKSLSLECTQDPRQRFLDMLPQIRGQARFAFRRLSWQLRADLTEEVIADAYVAFARLVELGKLDLAYPTPLALYSIRRVRAGRRVGTSLNKNDVTSPYAQRARGLRVERLDRFDQTKGCWKEIVVEDRRATPAEVAAARLDIADWFRQLPRRERAIAKQLAVGQRTRDVARRFRLSPARISQLRQELSASWRDFQGEDVSPRLVAA